MLRLDEEPDWVKVCQRLVRATGRILTWLAACMVVVPMVLKFCFPEERFPAVPRCGNTLENGTITFGLTLLVIRFVFKILKVLNDVSERYLTSIDEAARKRHLAKHSRMTHKPQPLDDF